jgi:transcriptional regulator with XRE-family HTH domain
MLGNRLRAERKAKGLTQTQLAELCGIRPNAQGHYEAGTRSPRADYLQRLSSLGFDVFFIISGERMPLDESQLSDSEHAVIQGLRSLEHDDRQTLQYLIAAMTRYRLGIFT